MGANAIRTLRLVVAATLAVGFIAGAAVLAPVRFGSSEPRPVPTPQTGALLTPAVAGGGLDGTIAALQRRLRSQPGDWRSYASLGLAYLQKVRVVADPSYYAKAEGVLGRSLDLHPKDNYDALVGMGTLAGARHDFAGALEWGRRARSANPYGSQARGVIGDALLELGRYREAVGAYQDMIDLRPDLASYARVSYARELGGDMQGAIQAMRLALSAATGNPESSGWVSYQLGELYFGSGRLHRALRSYRRGATLAPGTPLPPTGVAKVKAATGDPKGGARLLSKVVAGYPAPELLILLGDLYRAAGEGAKARSQYDLVRATERLYRANDVNTDLETALFDADHLVLRFRRSSEGVRPGTAETVARAREAYGRRPSIFAADALGWALYAAGRYRAAGRYADEALRLGTKSGLLHFHAGMIDLRLGDRGSARHHLARALSINPHFSFLHAATARRALARL